jgi:glycosyltransferase involved in cell wall biosynthesis
MVEPPVRVTFVIAEANWSGGVRVIAAHAAWLKQRGHRVVVVSMPVHAPTPRERIRALIREGRWPVGQAKGSPLDGTGVEHRVLERRRPVTAEDVPDADVVIATWWETAEWVAAMGPEKGAKVNFIQGDEQDFYPENDAVSRSRVVESVRLPMHRITVSGWIAERYRERGIEQIAVVRNGIQLKEFPYRPRERHERFRVGYIYAEPALKGADIAMEAVRRARAQAPDLGVVVFGSAPPHRGKLPEGAEFVLSPARARIPKLYSDADAWLFPSRSEGFGLPVVEAMACGTPVIAFPVGIAPEALHSGGGILLNAIEASEMARSIVEMSRLPADRWRMMSRRARAVAESYGWEGAAAGFESELRRACGRCRAEAVHA